MRPGPSQRWDNQHIRFPNITKLEFEGEMEKIQKNKALSLIGL
jgi:hypothetical protein